jgi:hypothetical protein
MSLKYCVLLSRGLCLVNALFIISFDVLWICPFSQCIVRDDTLLGISKSYNIDVAALQGDIIKLHMFICQ